MTDVYLQHTQSNYPYVHTIGILKTIVVTTYIWFKSLTSLARLDEKPQV